MHRFWNRRTMCVECEAESTQLIQWCSNPHIGYVCLQCAIKYGYHEVMLSIAEVVYGIRNHA